MLKQPDLGTALTYLPILICGLFLGWHPHPVRSASFCLALHSLAGIAWKSGKHLKPYQQARINAFINPDSDPRGSGYQIRQSLIAVGSGGIWGKGANKGTQTQGDFLPIPYTDFIFAAFCEEHGFVGALGVLLLYFLILMRLIQNAQTASDLPGSFIIMGVVAVITFQIAVNVGMVVGLMPVTGSLCLCLVTADHQSCSHSCRSDRHEHPHEPLCELIPAWPTPDQRRSFRRDRHAHHEMTAQAEWACAAGQESLPCSTFSCNTVSITCQAVDAGQRTIPLLQAHGRRYSGNK